MKNLNIDKSNWTLVKFGDVVVEPKETVSDLASSGLEHVVGLEHIDTESIHLRRSAGIEDSTTFTKRFAAGDVLFGRRRAYLKKAAQASFDGICSGDITVFRAKKNLLPELLPFIVNNDKFFDYAVKHSAGGLSPRVKFKDLANYEFLLPPNEQQAKLAELLWAMDKMIEKNLAVRSIANSCLHSVWQSLKKTKETIRLKDIATINAGTTPSTKMPEYWENGTVPWLPTGKVHNRFIRNSQAFVTELAVTQKKSKIFPKHSTLIAMIGDGKTRGSVAIMEIDAAINQNFACVTPKNIHPYYLFYCLSFCYDRLRDISQGTNQLALNCELIGNFRIPFVSEEKQIEIVRILSQFDNVEDKIQSHVIRSTAIQKSLINEVF